MGISETKGAQPCQAIKENSPTSGLLRFLVARGGINQGGGCLILVANLLDIARPKSINRPYLQPQTQEAFISLQVLMLFADKEI